jgi:hypothetical protein
MPIKYVTPKEILLNGDFFDKKSKIINTDMLLIPKYMADKNK